MFNRVIRLVIFSVTSIVCIQMVFAGDALLRFPDIHDQQVVFVSGEDIWKAPISGGTAVRLTMHDGEERYPKFSPDGTMIAFTGEYDGNGDVYIMDNNGANITRITFHPSYDEVVGWHPVKNKVVFRSGRKSFTRFYRLFMVSPDGSGLEEIPMHEIAQGSFSPDGKNIAFNKVARESRTWKRYKGGTAQEVYIYNFDTKEINNVTNFEGTDRIPMWIGSKVYFSSDRDRVLNLYSYDTVTGQIDQLTTHKEYDVRRPSAGKDKIVYELGGVLNYINLSDGKTQAINIDVPGDFPELRPYLNKVDKNITQIEVSPGGHRALLVARGEVFSVPKNEGMTRNLTNNSGAHDKHPVWSPDGKQIAYISDAAGEYDIYLIDAIGGGKSRKLTSFKDGYRHSLRWSPDGTMLAWTDQTLTLYYMDIKSKKITGIDKAEYENVDVALDVKPIYDFNWSPDSRFIAYSKMDQTWVNKIYVYSLTEKKIYPVSDGRFNDFHPVLTRDGNHLLFVSNRLFSPTYGDFEWEMVYKNMAGIYAMTLQKTGPAFRPIKSDEDPPVEINIPDNSKNVKIDFDGIGNRVQDLKLERGNYRYLTVNESHVFYMNKDEGDFNRFEFRVPKTMDLMAYSIKDHKEHTVIKEIDAYKLSADGSTIVYKQGDQVGLIESSAKESPGKPLTLKDLKMNLNPPAEWKQIFNEAWRLERDFYYEPNMHGQDWNLMKKKYGRLMEKATCRQDIRFIIGELIGELNTSHTYVYGGDRKRKSDRVGIGLLGTDYTIDTKNKLYRFENILRVADWTGKVVPPLSQPGSFVEDGEYLLAVNGIPVSTVKNIYSYFIDLAGKQITLLINNKPTTKNAREVTVIPLSNDYRLRYMNWIKSNRDWVEKESNGELGYIHFPDTYNGSAKEFPWQYYSQTHKKGIVVDGRFNGGGLDPDIFLQRLAKKPLAFWTRRYSHHQMTPWLGNMAHMVCITNHRAGSGGDELPHEFRQKGMGKIIGTRSWGGLVGVSMFIPLIDGGGLTAPDYRIYSPDGKWVVENEGVAPDIEVHLHPHDMWQGKDAQLIEAVKILKEEIKKDPRSWPQHEPFPVDR